MEIVGHVQAMTIIDDLELLREIGRRLGRGQDPNFTAIGWVIYDASPLDFEQSISVAIEMQQDRIDAWLYWIKLHCDGKIKPLENIKRKYDIIKEYGPKLEALLPVWPIPTKVSVYEWVMEEFGISEFYAALFVQMYNEGNPGAMQLFDDIVALGIIKPNTILNFDVP